MPKRPRRNRNSSPPGGRAHSRLGARRGGGGQRWLERRAQRQHETALARVAVAAVAGQGAIGGPQELAEAEAAFARRRLIEDVDDTEVDFDVPRGAGEGRPMAPVYVEIHVGLWRDPWAALQRGR